MYYFILFTISSFFVLFSIKQNLFFKMPIYISYVYSAIFFNIIGSYFVFYPKHSTALVKNKFLTSPNFDDIFFYILLIQCICFFIFYPLHRLQNFSLKDKNFFGNKNLKLYTGLMASLSFLIILFFIIQNGMPPFYSVNIGEFTNSFIISQRTEFFNTIGNFWIYSFGFYFIPNLVSILLFLNYKKTQSVIDRLVFFIYFFIACIFSLSFLHKTPIVFLVTQIFFAKIFIDNKIKLSRIFYFVSLSLLIIFVMYILSFSGEYYVYNFGFIVTAISESIFQRLLIIYSLSLSVVPELVDHIGFLNGKAGIINPLGLFNIDQFNLQKELHLLLYGFPGNNPPPATGYAYANFGLKGVIGLIFFINILIFLYQRICNKIRNKAISIFFTIFFMIKAISLSISSIWDTLLMPQELVLLLIVFVIYYLMPVREKNLSKM